MDKFSKRFRAKLLYKFLKKHVLLERYFSNLSDQHPHQRGVDDFLENGDFLTLLETNENIDHSFMWRETPEGHDFWCDMHDRERGERDNFYELVRHSILPSK